MIGVLTQKKPFSSKKRWIALRQRVPHARRRADHVGARPQMRDLAQKLHRVRLRLDRIGVGVVDPADHLDRARLHLERLPLGRRRHDRAGRLDRAAGGELQHLVCRNSAACSARPPAPDGTHDPSDRCTNEMPGLRVAPRAHPALDRDRRIGRRLAGQNFADAEVCRPSFGNHLSRQPTAHALGFRPKRRAIRLPALRLAAEALFLEGGEVVAPAPVVLDAEPVQIIQEKSRYRADRRI